MRSLLLLPILLLLACGDGDHPAATQSGQVPSSWGDDTLWAMLQAQDHRATGDLLRYLTNERPDVRERAARAFASSPDSAALPALIDRLKDLDPLVRKAVAVAIGNARTALRGSPCQKLRMSNAIPRHCA